MPVFRGSLDWYSLLVTGIAKVSIPFFFIIRFASKIKCSNGLKCCADSSAIILSTEFFTKGSIVDVELIPSI